MASQYRAVQGYQLDQEASEELWTESSARASDETARPHRRSSSRSFVDDDGIAQVSNGNGQGYRNGSTSKSFDRPRGKERHTDGQNIQDRTEGEEYGEDVDGHIGLGLLNSTSGRGSAEGGNSGSIMPDDYIEREIELGTSIERNMEKLSVKHKKAKYFKESAITGVFVLLWYFFATLLSLYNKWMFSPSYYNFSFPLFVTFTHMIVQFFLALVVRLIWPTKFKPKEKPGLKDFGRKIVPTAIATGLDIGLSNLSLKTITLTLYTMCKSSTLIFVISFAFLFHLEIYSLRLLLVIVCISFGVFLMVFNATTVSIPGIIMVFTASGLAGLRWAFTQMLMHKKEMGMSNPFATIFWLAPVMAATLALVSMVLEGWGKVFYSGFFDGWKAFGTMGLIVLPGGIAFAMVASEYYIIQRAGIVPLSIAGIFKEVSTIIVSSWVFGDELTKLNMLGVLIAVGGIALYSYHKYQASISDLASPHSHNRHRTNDVSEYEAYEALDTTGGNDHEGLDGLYPTQRLSMQRSSRDPHPHVLGDEEEDGDNEGDIMEQVRKLEEDEDRRQARKRHEPGYLDTSSPEIHGMAIVEEYREEADEEQGSERKERASLTTMDSKGLRTGTGDDVDDVLEKIRSPGELLKIDRVGEWSWEDLDQYRFESVQALHQLKEVLDTGTRNNELCDLTKVYNTVLRLYGQDAWCTETARDLIKGLLEVYPAPESLPLHLLQTSIRHAFQSPHPQLNLETSRASSRPLGGSKAKGDMFDSEKQQSWKGDSGWGTWCLLGWCITSLNEREVTDNIGLILPPMLTMLDDYETAFRLRGLYILKLFLDKIKPVTMKRMGIDSLFLESIQHSISLHPSPPSPPLLTVALPVLFRLLRLTLPMESATRAVAIAKAVDNGMINGWLYAPHGIQGKTGILEVAKAVEILCGEVGCGVLRWFKSFLPNLLAPCHLPPSAYTACIQSANLRTLKLLLTTVAETGRAARWRGEILLGIGKAYSAANERLVFGVGDDDEAADLNEVLRLSRAIIDILVESAPSMLEDEIPSLMGLGSSFSGMYRKTE